VEKTRAALDKLVAQLPPGSVERRGTGDAAVFQADLNGASLAWTIDGTYLRAAIGEDATARLRPPESKSPPAWLAEMRKEMPVERVASVMYVDVAQVRKLAVAAASGTQAGYLKQLGLDRVEYYATLSGLDEQGFVNHSLLRTTDGSAGPLGALSARPLTADDLRVVPANALFAAAAKIDLDRLYATVVELLSETNPQAGAIAEKFSAQLQQQLGIDLRRDVLHSLGDTWTVHCGEGAGILVFPAITATVSIRDTERFTATHAKLLSLLQAALARGAADDPDAAAPRIKEIKHRGHTVYYIDDISPNAPIAPAWCVTGSHLIVGLFPQSVTSLLSMSSADKNLASRPEVAALVADGRQTVALAYYDAPWLWEQFYPWLQLGVQLGVAAARREGALAGAAAEFDIASLPAAATVARHLRPGVAAMQTTPLGLRTVSRQSLPGPSAFDPTAAGIMMAMMFPALGNVMDAVNTNRSLNNASSIMKGLHVQAAQGDGRYPAPYSADARGRPLLSWRVHLLPMLDERALYEEFRLGEPWDSPHNAALIPRMPKVYRSPLSEANEGMTTYLAVRGKHALFVDDRTRRAERDIEDGPSNTAAIVEVTDELAIPWTSPNDLNVDDAPSLRDALFAGRKAAVAAFCDGHVFAVPAATPERALRAAVTIAGGEREGIHDE
jgi:hypothetical protein